MSWKIPFRGFWLDFLVISSYRNEKTQVVVNWTRHGDAGFICGRSCLPSHTDVGEHCHYRWFMLHWFIVLPILRLSTAPNKAFTHRPAMTCWFSFPSHKVNWRLVGSFSTVIGTQIKPLQPNIDRQLASSCHLFSTRESLTDVVYVWPDCVVGRSLTRVIIRLGNWESQRQREKEAEERIKERQEGRNTTLNVHYRKNRTEQLVSPRNARRNLGPDSPDDFHLMITSIWNRRTEIIFYIYCSSRRGITFSRRCQIIHEWMMCGFVFVHFCQLNVCTSLWFWCTASVNFAWKPVAIISQALQQAQKQYAMNIHVPFSYLEVGLRWRRNGKKKAAWRQLKSTAFLIASC